MNQPDQKSFQKWDGKAPKKGVIYYAEKGNKRAYAPWGIKAGQPYYWWKGEDGRLHASLEYPRPLAPDTWPDVRQTLVSDLRRIAHAIRKETTKSQLEPLQEVIDTMYRNLGDLPLRAGEITHAVLCVVSILKQAPKIAKAKVVKALEGTAELIEGIQ